MSDSTNPRPRPPPTSSRLSLSATSFDSSPYFISFGCCCIYTPSVSPPLCSFCLRLDPPPPPPTYTHTFRSASNMYSSFLVFTINILLFLFCLHTLSLRLYSPPPLSLSLSLTSSIPLYQPLKLFPLPVTPPNSLFPYTFLSVRSPPPSVISKQFNSFWRATKKENTYKGRNCLPRAAR